MSALLDRLTANGFAIYCSLMGAIFAAVALWLLVRRMRIAAGLRAQGQIVSYRQVRKQHVREVTQFQPTVRFQPRGGPPVEFESQVSADPEAWKIGHPVPVAYCATDPRQAEIATAARLWLAPPALLLLALGSFAAAWKAGG